MRRAYEYPIYLISSIILFVFTFLFMLSLISNTTIYSDKYYTDTFDSEYITKLKAGALRDMRAQSSFTGIPLDVISAGIDEMIIEDMLHMHI